MWFNWKRATSMSFEIVEKRFEQSLIGNKAVKLHTLSVVPG